MMIDPNSYNSCILHRNNLFVRLQFIVIWKYYSSRFCISLDIQMNPRLSNQGIRNFINTFSKYRTNMKDSNLMHKKMSRTISNIFLQVLFWCKMNKEFMKAKQKLKRNIRYWTFYCVCFFIHEEAFMNYVDVVSSHDSQCSRKLMDKVWLFFTSW